MKDSLKIKTEPNETKKWRALPIMLSAGKLGGRAKGRKIVFVEDGP